MRQRICLVVCRYAVTFWGAGLSEIGFTYVILQGSARMVSQKPSFCNENVWAPAPYFVLGNCIVVSPRVHARPKTKKTQKNNTSSPTVDTSKCYYPLLCSHVSLSFELFPSIYFVDKKKTKKKLLCISECPQTKPTNRGPNYWLTN